MILRFCNAHKTGVTKKVNPTLMRIASLVSLASSPSKWFVGAVLLVSSPSKEGAKFPHLLLRLPNGLSGAVLLVSFITIQNAIKPFTKILLVGV